uniref:BHLH domain-containing protein n=1 Tax=Ananas comosus var. bracteatus TaxID=296719 RepID=A0A6V7PCL8_ANACO|nr:unnamed protein product [Ananas comosus var. bracteatus]
MYHHHPELYPPHEHIPMEGSSSEFIGPSHTATMNFSDLALMGSGQNSSSNSSNGTSAAAAELDFHRQFGLDVVGKPEMAPHLMHFPKTSSLPRSRRKLLVSARPVNGHFVGGVMEEVYGLGQQLESPHLNTRRQKGGMRQKGLSFNGVEKKEKQRRERLSEKYELLKSLIPNRTKDDRATIISDTMDYIRELGRTVNELKLLVEKKRRKKERGKEVLIGEELVGDMESSSVKPFIDEGEHHASNASLRSSWLQRKSKETFVDVRIVEDEVTIKITQRKRMISCLLTASRILDELQLELLHLSGGIIGDCHITCSTLRLVYHPEGSSVYASAIAKKLIEVMDVQFPPQTC